MKPSFKELEAIKLAEQYYNKKDRSFKKKYLFLKFKFKSYDVEANKTLSSLWNSFGLKSSSKFKFTDDEKLECINKWLKILYNVDFDAVADYNSKLNKFQQQMKHYHSENPDTHVSWNFPSPEKYIKELEAKFGNYI
jgi:hypothetical protein